MGESFISRFTPSLMRAQEAEAIFVQRDAAAKELVGRLLNYVRGHAEQHMLFVGGPGLGKTHFLTVVHHRLHEHREVGGRLLTAWLREEHWALTSYGDLLLSILRALETETANSELAERIASLEGLRAQKLEEAAADLLRGYVGTSRLLVILEDVDTVFAVFSEDDIKHLRAFLDANPGVLFVTTARSLPESTQGPRGALRSVFTVRHLKELTADEAWQLVLRVASFMEDEELRAFARSPEGRAYIGAIHHVAGGIHRTYVVLAHHLNAASIKAPVEPLLRVLDELKPYHQGYLDRLSAQQRKIFQLLCEARHPIPVKDIANAGHMTHQTASGQLKTMRDLDYVHSIPVGRESYYECNLPLVRFGIELARHRGENLSRFLRFLRLWYAYEEQETSGLPLPDPYGALRRDFLLPSLLMARQAREDPHVADVMREFAAYAEWGDTARALYLADELVRKRGRPWDVFAKVHCEMHFGRWTECLEDIERLLERSPENAQAWAAKGFCLANLDRHTEAVDAYDRALELGLKRFEQIWSYRAAALIRLGRSEEARASCLQALQSSGPHPLPEYLSALADTHEGHFADALKRVQRSLKEEDRYPEALRLQGFILCRLGRYAEAVESLDKTLSLHVEDALAWLYRGLALAGQGDMDQASVSLERAGRLGRLSPYILGIHFQALTSLGRWDEAMASVQLMLERFPEISASLVHALTESVHGMLAGAPGEETWRSSIKTLVDLCERAGKSDALGVALVRALNAVRNTSRTAPSLHAWRSLWLELGHEIPALELPLRFLEAGIRFHQSQDIRFLLRLPVEERKLVVPLIAPRKHGPGRSTETHTTLA